MTKTLLHIAEQTARKAGRFIMDSVSDPGCIQEKGRADLVTSVDRGSERIIINEIRSHFPGHALLAEESGEQQSQSDFCWIIDPIDGTTNFVHGYPCFGVSIAVQQQGETLAGVVYDPFHDEMFSALRKGGAFLNGGPISVSAVPQLPESLLATGFPYKAGEHWERNMALFKHLYACTHGIRRDGSAALDLCYVASGRLDGFWEYGLNPWDVAAGILVVQEAGGRATDFTGKTSGVHDRQILASNGRIHGAMLDILAKPTL